MAIEYLKKAAKTPASESGEARKVVDEMLATIARDGEAAVRDYARKLDDWSGDIVVSADEIERRTRDIDASVKRDIEFATAQVRRFAQAQRDSMHEFSLEAARPDRWPAPDPGQCRRLLRADWTLCAHRIGLHDDCHRQGCRCSDGDRVLDTVPRRWHSSARAVCNEGRGRRRHHDARRRAGDRTRVRDYSPASPPTSSSAPAINTWPRPSALLGRSASTCLLARLR